MEILEFCRPMPYLSRIRSKPGEPYVGMAGLYPEALKNFCIRFRLNRRTPPVKLSITHIVGPIAPYESAVTPNPETSPMRDQTSSIEAAWQEELCGAALPDKRLVRRLQRLLD
ncbi:hypothetical protein [Mesorhizobium sp. M0239]|uniref:hypothetical protein n=1 Tax=Mesorhizobium sp. M0239 TaxID=2956924 RepID=UPI00333C098A